MMMMMKVQVLIKLWGGVGSDRRWSFVSPERTPCCGVAGRCWQTSLRKRCIYVKVVARSCCSYCRSRELVYKWGVGWARIWGACAAHYNVIASITAKLIIPFVRFVLIVLSLMNNDVSPLATVHLYIPLSFRMCVCVCVPSLSGHCMCVSRILTNSPARRLSRRSCYLQISPPPPPPHLTLSPFSRAAFNYYYFFVNIASRPTMFFHYSYFYYVSPRLKFGLFCCILFVCCSM